MKVDILKKCNKDIQSITDRKLAKLVLEAIDRIEQCSSVNDLKNVKRMKGAADHFRVRIGDYRLGFKVEDDAVLLMRFMHRKDLYRFFP